ncbi:MAG: hypothetical protein HQL55_04950 [Magnetococcales bacterium]|nr:hypothetical protein [Magnetococcales bacterium]
MKKTAHIALMLLSLWCNAAWSASSASDCVIGQQSSQNNPCVVHTAAPVKEALTPFGDSTQRERLVRLLFIVHSVARSNAH